MPKATVPEIFLRFIDYRPLTDDPDLLLSPDRQTALSLRTLNMTNMMQRGILRKVIEKLRTRGVVIVPFLAQVSDVSGVPLYGCEARWIGNWATTILPSFNNIGSPPWALSTDPFVTYILALEFFIRKLFGSELMSVPVNSPAATVIPPGTLPKAPPDSYFGENDASGIPVEKLVAAGVLPDENTPFTADADDENTIF